MALVGLLGAPPARLEAQCTLAGSPRAFEPNPPGVPRPTNPLLSPGFNNSLALYRSGLGGPRRLFMQESYGYSVLDLSNPANPTALYYRDNRYGSDRVTWSGGDGQSNVYSLGVSDDGQRGVFSLGGSWDTWYTVVGASDGLGFLHRGSFSPNRANYTLVQRSGSRYIAYEFATTMVVVADVTALPTTFTKQNMASENTGWPRGGLASLVGNYILYLQSGGAVRIIDASVPGPVGSITAAYPWTTITSADFGGRSISGYAAALDPADATKLWVLVELSAQAGENSPSYGLFSVTKVGPSSFAKVSAGAVWRVPSQAGEVWSSVGASSALIAKDGDLFVLMWAKQTQPSTQFRLYSTTANVWTGVPPVSFPVSGTGFALPGQTAGFGVAGTSSVYLYVPTTASAYVIPMSCVSINAVASMAVADQAGTPLDNGDTVFLGDQVTIAPSISPSPAIRPLTGFGWNFDFDFHPASAYDDDGAGSSPRLRAPDNGALGNPTVPPALITVVGPCDPQVGGTNLGSGTGCWNSVTTNGAFAGGTPDFTAAPATGSTRALTFAFEANNALGSAGARLFTLNWKVPAARVPATQVLTGQPLVSGSDGHPTSTGFKWYFGPTPTTLVRAAGCTGPTCVPTLDMTGTYSYWLTASYANGYVTPDYAGTAAMGTYTVTSFAPAFTVNGSASGPVTAASNQSLTVANSSQRGAGITATYQYNLCLLPCGPDAYQAWSAMADPPPSGSPPTSATIPVPAAPGSYALKIRVTYVGGTAYWPDPSGVAFFPLNVVSPLAVSASVNPTSASAGQFVTFSCSATGGVAPYSYQWRSPISFVIAGETQSTYQATSSVAGSLTAWCFVTDSASTPATSSASATATFIASIPVSVDVSASPNPAAVNRTVTFSCNPTGGLAPYSYQWRSPISFAIPGATQSTYQTTSSVAGNVSVWCFVTDSQPTPVTGSASATATFTAGGPYSLYVLNPCRILDTRNPAGPLGGPSIQPAGAPDRALAVTSSCGIPSDAASISVNVTVTNVLAPGVVSIYRGDGQPTGTTTIPLVPGRTRANNALLQLALDGSGTIKVQNTSSGTLDLIIDVNGYFR